MNNVGYTSQYFYCETHLQILPDEGYSKNTYVETHLQILSVPDEGYSKITQVDTHIQILSVPDEGYSKNTHVDTHIQILSVPDEGYSKHASCALNQIFTFLLLYTLFEHVFVKSEDNLTYYCQKNLISK